jgi:alpha-galactosidase
MLAECKTAKTLGFESIIVDDGWQTLDSQRGYAFTGDWHPQRLGDVRAFVESVHALDMKVLLWYSLPFVGWEATNHAPFEGKYLRRWESQRTDVLDPRYPEVREFIIQTYKTAVQDWDLDGLKLDFIDFFTAQAETELTVADGRDIASVNEAVDRLMTDLMASLRALKPDIMVEFRQVYIGPLMRKYGNMFRAADCPNMAAVNRNRTIDLRLLSGNTAVHSDMYMWHPEESVENAAQQLLNVLFSVPQLSVRLDTLPQEHLAMVKFWTTYWNENRDVLLDGDLIPTHPSSNYPSVIAHGKSKTIIALYETNFARISSEAREIDIINATSDTLVVLHLTKSLGDAQINIRTTTGELVSTDTINLGIGSHSFVVPASGILNIMAFC